MGERKILLKTLKDTCEKLYVYKRIFKDSTFSQELLKYFAETFQNTFERSTHFSGTCRRFTVIFHRL